MLRKRRYKAIGRRAIKGPFLCQEFLFENEQGEEEVVVDAILLDFEEDPYSPSWPAKRALPMPQRDLTDNLPILFWREFDEGPYNKANAGINWAPRACFIWLSEFENHKEPLFVSVSMVATWPAFLSNIPILSRTLIRPWIRRRVWRYYKMSEIDRISWAPLIRVVPWKQLESLELKDTRYSDAPHLVHRYRIVASTGGAAREFALVDGTYGEDSAREMHRLLLQTFMVPRNQLCAQIKSGTLPPSTVFQKAKASEELARVDAELANFLPPLHAPGMRIAARRHSENEYLRLVGERTAILAKHKELDAVLAELRGKPRLDPVSDLKRRLHYKIRTIALHDRGLAEKPGIRFFFQPRQYRTIQEWHERRKREELYEQAYYQELDQGIRDGQFGSDELGRRLAEYDESKIISFRVPGYIYDYSQTREPLKRDRAYIQQELSRLSEDLQQENLDQERRQTIADEIQQLHAEDAVLIACLNEVDRVGLDKDIPYLEKLPHMKQFIAQAFDQYLASTAGNAPATAHCPGPWG